MITKRLLVKAGNVVASTLGPSLGALGVDTKQVANKANQLTANYKRKVFILITVNDQKQVSVNLEPLTDAYALKELKLKGVVTEEMFKELARTQGDKSYAMSLEKRVLELKGVFKSINEN